MYYNGADPTGAVGPGRAPHGVELVDVRTRRIPRIVPVPVYTAIDYWIWQLKVRRLAKARLRAGDIDIIHHLSWGSLELRIPDWPISMHPSVIGPIGGGTRFPSAYRELVPFTWHYERLRNRLVDLVRFEPVHAFHDAVSRSCDRIQTLRLGNSSSSSARAKYAK